MPERQLSVELRQSAPIPLDVRFTCGAGDVLAIFGPSGSGKTTMLRSIAGLHRAAHELVRSGDEVWSDTAAGVFTPPHRRRVGVVFQDYALFPHMTAIGNVITALGHRPPDDRRRRAETLLATVHLSEHHERKPRSLSGGERQRVALARALARDPAVLLLDEPFAAIDRVVRRQLQDEIAALRRSLDLPIVLVTHDFDDVVRLASHVVLLERGVGVAAGPITELMSRPDLTWLRDAVGLGSVFDATLTRTLGHRGLVELTFDGGVLLATDRLLGTGTIVRVRIPAREVILATSAPEGLSLHNALSGTVSAIDAADRFEHVIVQVAVGNVHLLAEVTRDAISRLGVAVGRPVYALVKSVSIELMGRQEAGSRKQEAGTWEHGPGIRDRD